VLFAVGVALQTSPALAAAIHAGAHQIRVVDGQRLIYPSQDLREIESSAPERHGQTHVLSRHLGQTLSENVARLRAQPWISAAGSFDTVAVAQHAVDETIANPVNQRMIGRFLANPRELKVDLERVALGERVGTSTTRNDLVHGHPTLVPDASADVVLIKDPTFPEGYRVLTSFPDARPPQLAR
jgi:hypothetical protein